MHAVACCGSLRNQAPRMAFRGCTASTRGLGCQNHIRFCKHVFLVLLALFLIFRKPLVFAGPGESCEWCWARPICQTCLASRHGTRSLSWPVSTFLFLSTNAQVSNQREKRTTYIRYVHEPCQTSYVPTAPPIPVALHERDPNLYCKSAEVRERCCVL
jgi:hypothetical protein